MKINESHILIVEDQEVIAENLRRILVKLGVQNPKVACTPEEAREICSTNHFDLLLLDINLGKNIITGIELYQELFPQEKPHIYITANADSKTVKEASKTSPEGYIVKPFAKEAIYASIEIALSKISSGSYQVIDKGKKLKLNFDKVNFIKSEGNYIEFNLIDGRKILDRNSMKSIVECLPNQFIQVHRSFVINNDFVDSYSSTMVTVNGVEVPMGRSYKEQFDLKN